MEPEHGQRRRHRLSSGALPDRELHEFRARGDRHRSRLQRHGIAASHGLSLPGAREGRGRQLQRVLGGYPGDDAGRPGYDPTQRADGSERLGCLGFCREPVVGAVERRRRRDRVHGVPQRGAGRHEHDRVVPGRWVDGEHELHVHSERPRRGRERLGAVARRLRQHAAGYKRSNRADQSGRSGSLDGSDQALLDDQHG